MTSVRLEHLRKAFPDGTVGLEDFSLEVEDGEFLTFLGPSGCGKTTTLRMIAGLETPTSGGIWFGARRVELMSPAERNVAMVFQSYALYPHMTVRQNLAYPLKKRGVGAAEQGQRIAEVAALLKMAPLLDRRPRQLSGGQQQRVALGRAMVRDCDVFLLDEPLSNLDAELRAHMRTELIQLHQRIGRTTIYVTHDQMEAMTMSTRIAVLHQGRLQQVGTPDEIYHAPVNRFVAGFVGSPAMNFLEGRLEGGRFVGEGFEVVVPGRAAEGAVVAGVRAEALRIVDEGGAAVVTVVEKAGHEALVWLEQEGRRLVVRNTDGRLPRVGERVALGVDGRAVHLFDAGSGVRV